jgi:hypothetical protein
MEATGELMKKRFTPAQVKDMNWHRNHLISQLIVTQAEAEASEKVF